jgi:hypothetical protein
MVDILKQVDKSWEKDKVLSLEEIRISFDALIKTEEDAKEFATAVNNNFLKDKDHPKYVLWFEPDDKAKEI